MQLSRQRSRRDEIFARMIEAAAMHHPAAAGNPFGLALFAAQARVEPNEMERGADPGDAEHHMAPAQQKTDPIPEGSCHRQRLHPNSRRQFLWRRVKHAGWSFPDYFALWYEKNHFQ